MNQILFIIFRHLHNNQPHRLFMTILIKCKHHYSEWNEQFIIRNINTDEIEFLFSRIGHRCFILAEKQRQIKTMTIGKHKSIQMWKKDGILDTLPLWICWLFRKKGCSIFPLNAYLKIEKAREILLFGFKTENSREMQQFWLYIFIAM